MNNFDIRLYKMHQQKVNKKRYYALQTKIMIQVLCVCVYWKKDIRAIYTQKIATGKNFESDINGVISRSAIEFNCKL